MGEWQDPVKVAKLAPAVCTENAEEEQAGEGEPARTASLRQVAGVGGRHALSAGREGGGSESGHWDERQGEWTHREGRRRAELLLCFSGRTMKGFCSPVLS